MRARGTVRILCKFLLKFHYLHLVHVLWICCNFTSSCLLEIFHINSRVLDLTDNTRVLYVAGYDLSLGRPV